MDKKIFEQVKQNLHSTNSQWAIRQLQPNQKLPMDLLLLADPSEKSIEKYIHKSKIYIAVENTLVVGGYVLMEIAPRKAEIMNVAVAETHQGKGIGQHAIKSARLLRMESIEIGTGNSSIQ